MLLKEKNIKIISTSLDILTFTIETLKPMGLTIINGITNFIPDVFKGLRKGFSWLWGTFESTKGYQLTLGKLSEIRKNILESLEAALGEWSTSTSDIVESSFRGKIRGPIKIIMSPFGNKLNRIMAKSIANNNEELLDLIKNTKVLNNENMNEFLKNVKESQLNLVNHSVLKITENIRKIFRVTEIEKDDSFMLKGLRTAAAVPLWGAKQGLNLLSIAIKGIGSVFGSLFSSLLKNPALTLNGIRLVWGFVEHMYQFAMDSMFTKSQQKYMTTTDKVASFVEWGIKKLWDTIIDSLSLLSPSVIWDAVCGIFSGIGSLVGKAWNGIKSWWNGEDSSSKITVTLDKKDAESIKKSNETLGTLLENSIPKPDQKGETFFEKIENTLIAIKNKIEIN